MRVNDDRMGNSQVDLPLWLSAIVLILLAWTSVMLPGFAFPHNNNIFHIPIVLNYADSAEGPHDAFTASLDSFVSAVWPLLGLVTNERNIFSAFFLAHLFSRLLFVAGFYGLIRHFSANSTVALGLTGLASLAPIFRVESFVGRNDTLLVYFTHTELAMAMLPGCFWLIVRGRWVVASAVIGVMFNVNAFIAAWSVVAAVLAIFVMKPTIKFFWHRLAYCGLVFLFLSLPTAVWTLNTVAEPSRPIDFRNFLLSYYPFHTFVHVQWQRLIGYLAYALAACLAVMTLVPQIKGEGARVLTVLLATFAGIFTIGVILPYVTGSQILLSLYPLRMDSVVNILVAMLALAWAGQYLQPSEGERDALPMAIAVALLIGNAITILMLMVLLRTRKGGAKNPSLLTWATALAMLLLISASSLPQLGSSFVPLKLLFGAIILFTSFAKRDAEKECAWIGLVTASLTCSMVMDSGSFPWPLMGVGVAFGSLILRLRWTAGFAFASAVFTSGWALSFDDFIGFVSAAAITSIGFILAAVRANFINRIAGLSTSPEVLLGGLGAIFLTVSVYAGMRGTVERPGIDFERERQAETWVRQHVPPGTTLLKVGAERFGVLARRPIWTEHKAGAAVMWQPSYLPEWQSRMAELNKCGDNSICYAALANRHGISWIVATPSHLSNPIDGGLALKFDNGLYQVYSLQVSQRQARDNN